MCGWRYKSGQPFIYRILIGLVYISVSSYVYPLMYNIGLMQCSKYVDLPLSSRTYEYTSTSN